MSRFILGMSILTAGMAFSAPVNSMLGADGCELATGDGLYPIPEGAVRVEYIAGTGTQWFDTGTKLSECIHLSYSFCCRLSQNSTWDNNVIGGRVTNGTGLRTIVYNTTNPFYQYTGFGRHDLRYYWKEDTDYEIRYEGYSGYEKIVINEEPFEYTDTVFTSITTPNLYCFAINNNGEEKYFFRGRIYYIQVCVDGSLFLDLIPIRTQIGGQWEGGMFNRVSGEIFLNQGTDSFIIGPDMEEEP